MSAPSGLMRSRFRHVMKNCVVCRQPGTFPTAYVLEVAVTGSLVQMPVMFHDLYCAWQEANLHTQRERTVMVIRLGLDCFALANDVNESLSDRDRCFTVKHVHCMRLNIG